jgi:hypothetical protein
VSAMACDRFKFVGVKPLPKEEALSKGEWVSEWVSECVCVL